MRINSSAPPGLLPPGKYKLDGDEIKEKYANQVKDLRSCSTIPTSSIQYNIMRQDDKSFVSQTAAFQVDQLEDLIGKEKAGGADDWDKI